MNDCEKYQEMISCLIDGELSEEDRVLLNAHIAVCPECASLLKIYRGAFTSSDPQTGSVEPPAELLSRVMEQVSGSKKTKKKRLYILYRVLPAVACIAIVLLVLPHLLPFSGSKKDTASVEKFADGGSSVSNSITGEARDDIFNSACNTAAQNVDPRYMTSSAIAGLEGYCAYVEISGKLPDLLASYEMTDDGNGVLYVLVPESLSSDLEKLGYAIIYVSESDGSGQLLVLYTP